MIAKLSAWLGRIAKGWLLLVFFAAEIFFNALVLPGAEAQIKAFSGGVGPLDLTLFPSATTIISAIAAYGEAGRVFYTNFEMTTDILYPIAYTFFFSLLITYLLQRAIGKDSKIQQLNVLPFGAWLFDLIENICIVILLSSFPVEKPLVAGVLTIANGIKWIFAGVSILAMLFAFGAWVVKKIKRK